MVFSFFPGGAIFLQYCNIICSMVIEVRTKYFGIIEGRPKVLPPNTNVVLDRGPDLWGSYEVTMEVINPDRIRITKENTFQDQSGSKKSKLFHNYLDRNNINQEVPIQKRKLFRTTTYSWRVK